MIVRSVHVDKQLTQLPQELGTHRRAIDVGPNGRRYRGYLEIRRYSDSDLTVINILDLEKYLYGVVPYEIEADAPLEAIKAQAVAARTYAYRNIGSSIYQKWGFDMVDTVSSQVYKGFDGERASTNKADRKSVV